MTLKFNFDTKVPNFFRCFLERWKKDREESKKKSTDWISEETLKTERRKIQSRYNFEIGKWRVGELNESDKSGKRMRI